MDYRPLPPAAAISTLLTDLLGKAVTVKPGKPIPLGARDRGAIGTYLLDDKRMDAVAVCDFPLGAALGASLALISPGVAADCVKRGQLDDNLVENLKEVLNVVGVRLNSPGAPHVSLGPVYIVPPTPKEILEFTTKAAAKLDISVTVAGYAPGNLSLLVARHADAPASTARRP